MAGVNYIGISITHSENVDEILQKTKPKICIHATKSFLADILEDMKILGRNKIHVVTIAEEAFDSWNTSPEVTKEIDENFKLNQVTFSATGY